MYSHLELFSWRCILFPSGILSSTAYDSVVCLPRLLTALFKYLAGHENEFSDYNIL
jgi:hypothetical protein